VGVKCDKNSPTLLRIATYSYFETRDSAKALAAAEKLFSTLKEEKIVAVDCEYYGKILAQNGQDSLAAEMFRKAFALDNKRCDLLSEAWESYDKIKKHAEAASALQEKIQNCKATPTDYYQMGRSWFLAGEFHKADSAMMKVNELSPKYASGFLWRAKANFQIDSTDALSSARPHYEKYIEVALADTAGAAAGKYKLGLIEAYRYLASNSLFRQKDRQKAKEFLRKILEIDAADQNAIDGIKGLEFEEKQEREKREKGSGNK
jgi:tetratricopeptide (TPR) repeat protein